MNSEKDKTSNRGSFYGYILFLDISGFTALTENYMKKGFKGAEDVSNLLNSIFRPIIKIINNYGGRIVVFAGDAVTAVFEGRDSQYAVLSSIKIMRFIKNSHSIKVKIKVSISSGKIYYSCYSNGKNSINYFEGVPFGRIGEIQKSGQPNQILMDRNAFKSLNVKFKKNILKVNKFYTVETDSNIEIVMPSESKKVFELSNQNRILAKKAEFRSITALFIDFSSVKGIKNKSLFIAKVLAVANRYEANFNMIDSGDKGNIIFILFGAPVSFEDDKSRALNFIMDLKNEMHLPFKAGLNSGYAFTGMIGSSINRKYTAIGDSVNSAARLMSMAGENEAVLSENVFRDIQEKFECEYAGTLSVKGKSDKIHAYKLKGRFASDNRVYETKFIGRAEQLKLANKFSSELLEKQNCGLLAVFGDPGAGKSRLIHEMCLIMKQSAEEYIFICDNVNKKAFHIFIDFIKKYFKIDDRAGYDENRIKYDEIKDEFIRKYAEKTGSCNSDEILKFIKLNNIIEGFIGFNADDKYKELDAKARYDNTEIALMNFFKMCTRLTAVIFVIEDYQWIDSESKKMVLKLTNLMKDENSIIIISSRFNNDSSKPILSIDEDMKCEEILLKNFEKDELTEFLKERFFYKIEERLFNYIMDKSSGNPFYAEQIALYLLENGYIEQVEGKTSLVKDIKEIPSNVYSLVISRIDRLTDSLKKTVQTASVVGAEFEIEVLSRVLKNFDTDKNLQDGIDNGIWNRLNELKYIFKHSIIRDAAYEMQMKKDLMKIHIIIANALEEIYKGNEMKLYDIAIHFDRGGKVEKAKKFYRSASKNAIENYRNSEAIRIFQRLSEMALTFSERLEEIFNLVDIFEMMGQWNEIFRVLDPIIKEDNDSLSINQNAEIMTRIGGAKLKMGDTDEAVKMLDKVEKTFSESGNVMRLMMVYNLKSMAYMRKGEFRSGLNVLNNIFDIEKGKLDKQNEIRILSMAHINAGYINQELRNFDESVAHYKKAMNFAEMTNDKRLISKILINVANIYYFKNDFAKAEEIYNQQLDLCREIGDKYSERVILNNLGAINTILNRTDRALECMNKSYEISKYISEKRGMRLSLGNMGSIYSTLGEFEKGMTYLKAALQISRDTLDKKGIAVILDDLSKAYCETGDYELSFDITNEGISLANELKLKITIISFLTTRAQIYLFKKKYETAKAEIYKAFELIKENSDIEEFLRSYITKEICESGFDKNRAIDNFYKYADMVKDTGARGRILSEIFFLSKDSVIKAEALKCLELSYSVDRYYLNKKYIDCINSETSEFIR